MCGQSICCLNIFWSAQLLRAILKGFLEFKLLDFYLFYVVSNVIEGAITWNKVTQNSEANNNRIKAG